MKFLRGAGDGPGGVVRSRWLPWSLCLLALVAAAAMGFLWQRAEGLEDRRRELERVTRAFLVALTNFQASTIEADVREIEAFAVGEFADQVQQVFGPGAVAAIREAGAKSVGRVRSVFVQSISGSTASVFAVVDETITNRRRPGPRREVLRIDIELIETRDGWRVSRVELLQSPAPGALPAGPGARPVLDARVGAG